AAGTGLSTHELNQPGCYRDVKDRTATVMFKISKEQDLTGFKNLSGLMQDNTYFLAWTTTPWTLPSNTALAVGKNIEYLLIKTQNQFSGKEVSVIIAKDLASKYFTSAGSKSIINGQGVVHNDVEI